MTHGSSGTEAAFDVAGEGRASIRGSLTLATVGALLESGTGFVTRGSPGQIDLAGVGSADSAGLALLVEWLSLSRGSGGDLRYENIPAVVLQLARLSEVESLLNGMAGRPLPAAQGVAESGSASGSSGG